MGGLPLGAAQNVSDAPAGQVLASNIPRLWAIALVDMRIGIEGEAFGRSGSVIEIERILRIVFTRRNTMKTLRMAAGALLVATTFALLACAKSLHAAAPPDGAIERLLHDRVEHEQSTGVVVGVLDPRGARVVAYGKANAPGDLALDGDTVFEIGSITKVFTSALLSIMVARGEVNLDDPVSKYLPQGVKMPSRGNKQITLLHLATQTSCLPGAGPDNFEPKDPWNPYADYTVQRLYDFLSRYQLPRDPGEKYEYSNLNFAVLGHVLELRAGKSFEVLLTERILKPLGMRDTAITLPPSLQARFATGHEDGQPVPHWDSAVHAGAGGLRSTVHDLMKFLAANLDASVAPLPAVLRQTQQARHAAGSANQEIGLGWHILHQHERDFVWHNGGTGGFSSYIGFDSKQHVGVVVLSNSRAAIDDLALHLLDDRFPLKKPPQPRQQVAISPQLIDAYVGHYQLSPTFTLTVTREGDELFLQASSPMKKRLYPESETRFFLKFVDAQITFEKDAAGKVTHLVLHQNGRDIPGKRID